MGKKASPIALNDRVSKLLNQLLSKHQISKQTYERIYIVVRSAADQMNKDIAQELGSGIRKVALWRKRWYDKTKGIDITLDQNGDPLSDKKVVARIYDLLSDSPRSGSPARITAEEIIRLQALACESPEDYGHPFTVWTHKELSKQAQKLGIKISPSRYGVLLKKTNYARTNQTIGCSPI